MRSEINRNSKAKHDYLYYPIGRYFYLFEAKNNNFDNSINILTHFKCILIPDIYTIKQDTNIKEENHVLPPPFMTFMLLLQDSRFILYTFSKLYFCLTESTEILNCISVFFCLQLHK